MQKQMERVSLTAAGVCIKRSKSGEHAVFVLKKHSQGNFFNVAYWVLADTSNSARPNQATNEDLCD